MITGRTRQNKLVHFAAPSPLRAGTYARVEVTGAAAASPPGELVEVLEPAQHRMRIPVVARLNGSSRAPLAIVGPDRVGQVGAGAWPSPRALAGVELVSVDAMQVYRGMDIGTAKPTPAERAEVPHHRIDLVDPADDFTVVRVPARPATRRSPTSRARGNRAVLVGGTGLYLRAVDRPARAAGRVARRPGRARGRAATSTALHARLAALDPVAAARMTSRRTGAGSCGRSR